jgi:hypothetical protein
VTRWGGEVRWGTDGCRACRLREFRHFREQSGGRLGSARTRSKYFVVAVLYWSSLPPVLVEVDGSRRGTSSIPQVPDYSCPPHLTHWTGKKLMMVWCRRQRRAKGKRQPASCAQQPIRIHLRNLLVLAALWGPEKRTNRSVLK